MSCRLFGLREQDVRRFEDLLEALEEAGGGGAVGDAVVEGQGEGHLVADGELVVYHGRLAGDAANPEDTGFGQVDDRREGFDTVVSEVRDRERRAAHVVRAEAAR